MVKWAWAAVLFTFLGVNLIAIWRLDAGGKKRAQTIMWVIVVLIGVQNLVRDVFEIREVSKVGNLVVGLAALIATVILLHMLPVQRLRGTTGIESGAEDEVQALKLN